MNDREFNLFCSLALMGFILVSIFVIHNASKVEENSADAICQKHYQTDSKTVTIDKAKRGQYKIKPNEIKIICGE